MGKMKLWLQLCSHHSIPVSTDHYGYLFEGDFVVCSGSNQGEDGEFVCTDVHNTLGAGGLEGLRLCSSFSLWGQNTVWAKFTANGVNTHTQN